MTDTKKTIKCPACEKIMQKIFMSGAGVNIDICLDGCGGIFFDNREFQRFDDKEENIDVIINAIEGKIFDSVDSDVTRICPACGAKMVKNYVSQKHKIMIDECYSCGGKFLDNKELQATRDEYCSVDEKRNETEIFVREAVSKGKDAECQYIADKANRHPVLRDVFDYVIDSCNKKL